MPLKKYLEWSWFLLLSARAELSDSWAAGESGCFSSYMRVFMYKARKGLERRVWCKRASHPAGSELSLNELGIKMLMPQFPSGWTVPIHLIRDVLHIINRQRRPLFFTRAQWKLVFHLGRKWKSRLSPPARGLIRNFQQPLYPFLEGPRRRRKLRFSPIWECPRSLARALSIRKKAPYWLFSSSRALTRSQMIFIRVATIMITTWSCNWPSALILFNPYQNKRLYWPLCARLSLLLARSWILLPNKQSSKTPRAAACRTHTYTHSQTDFLCPC